MNSRCLEILESELQEVEILLRKELSLEISEFETLIRPLLQAGGKRIRARLCLMTAMAGRKEERLLLGAAIEMLHLSTLIHDDVIDQAGQRRGVPTIHCTESNKIAILTGDYLLAKAFMLVSKINNEKIVTNFAGILETLARGEFLQMQDLYDINQSVERYLLKTRLKTANFIATALRLGAYLGNWSEQEIDHFYNFGESLGMVFQLTDDILDYCGTSETAGKPTMKDLREGVLTYPLLSARTEENKSFMEKELSSIKQGGSVARLHAYIVREGGVAKAEGLVADYETQALDILQQLPDFPEKKMLELMLLSLSQRQV